MHIKTLVFVSGIALGIVIGFMSPLATELAIAATVLAIVQIGVYAVERKRNTEGIALSLFTFLFSCALCIGVIRVQFIEEKIPFTCDTSCTFEARIITSSEKKGSYQTVIVRPLDATEDMFDVQIRIPLYPEMKIGETIALSGKVTIPDTLYPHADEHGREKSFDYASYLHTKHVGSQMLFPKLTVIDADAHTVRDVLGRWKEDLVSRMETFVSSPASSLANGMLFGDSSMSKASTATFRVAGLSHIVVLSGFNIAIVIAFVLFVFAFVPFIIRVLLASSFVVMFVFMVGGEVSVIRAVGMSFIGLFATLVGRQYVARQALLVSLLTIVLYEPYALLKDVSLHLSFLATAGIIYLSEPIKLFVQRYVARASAVELITTTLAAYISTLPYIMYAFGTVSVYSLFANVLALPLVPFAMLVSFLTVLASYVSATLALGVGYVNTLLVNCIIFIAETTERLPFSSFTLSLSFSSMCAAYAVLPFLVMWLSKYGKDETSHTTESGYLTDIIKY